MLNNKKTKFSINDRVKVVDGHTIPMVMTESFNEAWKITQQPILGTDLGTGIIKNVIQDFSPLYEVQFKTDSFYVSEEFLRLDVIGYAREIKKNEFI